MSVVTPVHPAMPTSKKRCWTLLVKDIKNLNVKEAAVMSAFRKRYTSARNLAFRSPSKHGGGTLRAIGDNQSTTLLSTIEEGTVLIEIHFAGPQPIEGPAGLLCTLLKSTFVAAYPIPLGRGRKRKVRAGVAGASVSLTSAPSNSSGSGSSSGAGKTDVTTSTSTSNRSASSTTRGVSSDDGLSKYLLDGSIAPSATSTLPPRRLPQDDPNARQPNTDGGAANAPPDTRNGLTPYPSGHDRAAGHRCHDRRESVASQHGTVSHWAGGASTAPVAATASQDGRWGVWLEGTASGQPPRSYPVRQPSWPGDLYRPPAPAKVENNNSRGGNAHSNITRDPRAFSASTTAMEQQQQQQQRWGRSWHGVSASNPDAAGGLNRPAARHQISFTWREEECDFDGRSITSDGAAAASQISPHRTLPVGSRCYFKFRGLQSAVQGHELHDLAIRALFFIDTQKANTVEQMASPLAVDASGEAHATVTYPSMLEIWPEMYIMDSIRVMEVAMVVEVRSRDGSFVYTGPTVKVVYRRPFKQVFASNHSMAGHMAGHVSKVPCVP